MSFKSDFQNKAVGILADIDKRKRKLSAQPKIHSDDADFSTAPGRTGDLQDRKWLTRKVEELTTQLAEASTCLREIHISQLTEVPGRRRKLSKDAFNELVENLRNNELVTPITVRELADGAFEIISGHNRVAAYRQLGKETISAAVKQSDDIGGSVSAFYANLLQTDLSDYEKYLGFSMLQSSLNLTQAQVAQHSGMATTVVSRIMAFSGLPQAALAILDVDPSILGAHAASQLAALSKTGDGMNVVRAVEQLSRGEIDQKQAIRVAQKVNPSVEKARPISITIKTGKAKYCQLMRTSNWLRIQLPSPEEAAEVEEAIKQVLQKRAEAIKGK